MKTFVRLIRRYILAAVGIMLLFLLLCIGLVLLLGWRQSKRNTEVEYSALEIGNALELVEGILVFDKEHSPEEWMDGYAWAMVLDENGTIIWNYDLPETLSHHYTPSDVARFTRWYLEDYPVICQIEDYGLFVIALPQGSLWKYNLTMSPGMLTDFAHAILPSLLGMLFLGLAVCFTLSWWGTRHLQTVANGLDALAEGQTVQLPATGFTGELAEKLNQTSTQLQKRNEIIARRDNTRTQWIAGVSHDVRTPLALILGWAEQLEQDKALPVTAQKKAGNILLQCEKLRALIDDLNLTSKLQYGAQPLRREVLAVGPLLRELVAQFYDSPLAEGCEIELTQTPEAEHAQLSADRALLWRLLENLLHNSVRHNASPVTIQIHGQCSRKMLELTISDNGSGYPPAVLSALHETEPSENMPHILGLHVVEQIAAAHGGCAVFEQNVPYGAKATIWLPLGG